jgi:hypothetical protein
MLRNGDSKAPESQLGGKARRCSCPTGIYFSQVYQNDGEMLWAENSGGRANSAALSSATGA